MAVDIYFSGDRVLRTTDELNIVEVARELGKANEAPGVRFAEIKTQRGEEGLRQPGYGHVPAGARRGRGFRRLRLGTSIGALHCPAARSGARRERGLPRPTPTRHSTRGAELLAADAPRGSRRDYCWSPRIQRSAVVSAPLPDSLERALHAHADEGSGGRAARAWPTGAAGPQPRARALPACVAECGNCDMLPSTIAPRCVAILSRSTGRLDPSSSLPARAASRRQALGRGAGY